MVKVSQNNHTTDTMFDCQYDLLFLKCCAFTSDVTRLPPFKNVPLLAFKSTEYFHKV